MNEKNIRYRCDNPECTSGIKGGGFFVKECPCPYCGSNEYHSFEVSIESLEKVINDLIKSDYGI
jgi:hypothetical protein